MAKTINLAEKYSKQVQERFYEDSYTQSSFATDLDAEFVGVKTVRVYEVDTAPMNDYTRSGTSRYGTPKELNDNVYEFQMKKDRSFTYTIDKGNQAEQMNIKEAGKTLRRQMREVVTPEIDEYRMKVWAEQAGQHAALAAAPSKTTIVEALMDANVALDKKHVPKKNRTFYIDISYYKYLKLAVEHIQPLAVIAEQLHLGDEVGGVLLLFALLLNEPVQHLHGAEVLGLVCGGVDGIDAGGDQLLMRQRLFQRGHVVAPLPLRLCDSRKGDALAIILQILIKQRGVIPLLLRLHPVPVLKAV